MEKREGDGREGNSKGKKASAQRMTEEDLRLPCMCFHSFPLPGLWKVLERRVEMTFNNWDMCVSPILRYEHLPVG